MLFIKELAKETTLVIPISHQTDYSATMIHNIVIKQVDGSNPTIQIQSLQQKRASQTSCYYY